MKKMTTRTKVMTTSMALLLMAGMALPATFAQGNVTKQNPLRKRPPFEVSKENIADGVVVTKTSDDAEVVKRLQEAQHVPFHEDEEISVSKENLPNGVKMTITSTDEEKVKQIQEGPKKMKMKKHWAKHMRSGEKPHKPWKRDGVHQQLKSLQKEE